MVASFLCFMLGFAAIGISSMWRSRGTTRDYYLASSSVSPALVGLSAVATNNSGYMFIGVIGFTYVTGLASVWLMLGWIAGDLLASLLVHRRLREATRRSGEVSYAGVLAHWHGRGHRRLQRVIALVALPFLMAYAGAQLLAGSKALHVLLDWPLWAGAMMGTMLVVAYCLAGGIRASIWTDVAQSIVMMGAMAALLVVGGIGVGGPGAALAQMAEVPGFLDWFPRELALPGLAGGLLFIVGWMFAGLSVIGQPHIMVRFMALADARDMYRARLWYYGWYLVFYAMATAVGMLSRLYLVDTGSFDAELALPTMALQLLPPVMVGFVLAGIFAATMSTADSLILSCSAAITHDLLPHKVEGTGLVKAATIGVALVALGWALAGSGSVFSLVIMSWSGLASAFAPLLLFLALGDRPGYHAAVLALLVGLGTALLWRYLGWHQLVYEGLGGILAGVLVLAASRFIARRRSAVCG